MAETKTWRRSKVSWAVCHLLQRGCIVNGVAYYYVRNDNYCPYQVIRHLQLQHDGEQIVMDRRLALLFNLTIPRKVFDRGCPPISMYATTIPGLFVSLDPQTHLLKMVTARNVHESQDLLPSLQYLSHHFREKIKSMHLSHTLGNCEKCLRIGRDRDHQHPVKNSPGLFVRRNGRLVHEYRCNLMDVPLRKWPIAQRRCQ